MVSFPELHLISRHFVVVNVCTKEVQEVNEMDLTKNGKYTFEPKYAYMQSQLQMAYKQASFWLLYI